MRLKAKSEILKQERLGNQEEEIKKQVDEKYVQLKEEVIDEFNKFVEDFKEIVAEHTQTLATIVPKVERADELVDNIEAKEAKKLADEQAALLWNV